MIKAGLSEVFSSVFTLSLVFLKLRYMDEAAITETHFTETD